MTGVQGSRAGGPQHRRRVLRLFFLAGATGLLGSGLWPRRGVASAAGKLGQKEIGYQGAPKGGQRCDNCVNWQPPSACAKVAGPISPLGWCGLYVRKS